MKIVASLIALVASEDWPGQDVVSTCGSISDVTMTGSNSINGTCTISTDANVNFMSIGGAFWTGASTFTTFQEMGMQANVLVFYSQSVNADGTLDNSTCGEASSIAISCVDNGVANSSSNLIGNFAFAPDNNSFQVPVANPTADFTVDLSAFSGHQNETCNSAAMTLVGDSLACAFPNRGNLGYFGFQSDSRPANPNTHFT